ncbi:MAG: hypothetical protein HGB14_05690, partial [Anaerolineaceae bacterium]|nr:hypothetical protein [Anaerolineaceae bacterium]
MSLKQLGSDKANCAYVQPVSINNAGTFVIAWEDYRNGNSDIYYQKYDSIGIPQTTNKTVNQLILGNQASS